jgi:uncharacterized phage protein (TIGR02218 family)
MAYEDFEEGAEGYPVELYLFKRGLSERYTLTSSNEVITFDSEDYFPIQIQRATIEQNSEMERQPLNIKIQRDADVLQNFVGFPPTEIMTVTIFRFHNNDTPTPEVVTLWAGRVLSVDWAGSQATIHCEPVFTSLKRPGLRRKYSAQCPHILYGGECQLNNFAFSTVATVTAITNGVELFSASFVNSLDFYFGGYLQFDNREFRTIVGDDGAGNVIMANSISEFEVGDQVTIFPGCAHDLDDCVNKFSNIENYGGFPYVPVINPFGGTILF